MTGTDEVDVVVVGAGLAGLTTALTAGTAGAQVLVLEKQPTLGGSTLMSGGWFAFSNTEEQHAQGVNDSDADFVTDMMRAGDGFPVRGLLDAYADAQHGTYDWLRSEMGVRFDVLKISSGQSVPRSHHADIEALMAELEVRIASLPNVEIRTSTRVERLLTDGGRVDGVLFSNGADSYTVRARRGVVLASGGFSRSTELLALFAPAQLEAIPHGGKGNEGDGIKMAWRLGAGLRDVAFVSGTYGSHPETADDEHELLTAFYMGAVVVNSEGHRFIDESRTYKEIGATCLRQPGGLGFQIFDQAVRDMSQPGVPLSDIGALETKGHLHRADTLEALADVAGIDADVLVATVSDYNRTAGTDADALGRTSLCSGAGQVRPLSQPPFYAYPAKTLMTSTYGGLAVTREGRVHDIDGIEIPGLWAVGEVTGGFHGSSYVTGTALGKCAIFGRVVGRALTG
jgi:fumarate reductase flavoprotein subunit